MTANPVYPMNSDEPSEPDWDALAATLRETRDYLTDADWDGAHESVTVIDMLLDATDPAKSPEEIVCHLLYGVRELCRWWGYVELPANIRAPVRVIRDALADADGLAVVTYH